MHFSIISAIFFYASSLLTVAAKISSPQQIHISNYSIKNVFNPPDAYYKDSFVFVPSTNEDPPSDIYKINDKTAKCIQDFKELGDENEEIENCKPGLVDLAVSPNYVARSHISYPFATMNISATAYSPISSIFIRLDCLYAETGDDKYCYPSQSSLVNGKAQQPCRSLKIQPSYSEKIEFPVRLSYSGFRLFSHSIYRVNVTVFPQNCRASLILTSPTLQSLFPNALMDPEHADPHSSTIWAPMLIVDFSDNDGVWIRTEKAQQFQCEKTIINVLKQNEGSLDFVKAVEIECQSTGVKWENVEQGKYLLVSYVPLNGCKYRCEMSQKHCLQCLQTYLNVTIPEDRTSAGWKAVRKLKDSSDTIVISVIVLSIVLLLAAIGYLIYLRKKKPADPTEIELNEIVKVLMIYSDDCPNHTTCVTTVVDCLRYNANAEVLFDVEQLNEPGVLPSRWLVDSFCEAGKHLIFISPCSVVMLDSEQVDTHHLVQNRPFPDIFIPAMDMIIRESTFHSNEARKKFAIVRFPYSPPTPRKLEVLSLPTFLLPDQFAQLTAFLHDVVATDNYILQENLRLDLAQKLKTDIKKMELMMENEPDWMNERWKEDETIDDVEDIVTLSKDPGAMLSSEEMRQVAERLNLLPPDSDSDDFDEDDTKVGNNEEDIEKRRLREAAKSTNNGSASSPFVLYAPSDSDSD